MELTMLVMLTAIFALQLYSLLIADSTKHEKRSEAKLDAKAEEAMKKEAEKSNALDEGFENIMRYSVNGHDGFGGGM